MIEVTRTTAATVVASQPEFHLAVDLIEDKIKDNGVIECPVSHYFLPGMYVRVISMARGVLLTSRIHATTHFFVVMKGAAVVTSNEGIQEIKAPFMGITTPGTRRVIFIKENCTWATFHATPIADSVVNGTMTEDEAVALISTTILYERGAA